MKTITKTFYVNDIYLEAIKSEFDRSIVIRQRDEAGLDGIAYPATNKIQISWQEPEKKIEITESEFDELAKEWNRTPSEKEKFNFLRQRLFGASDE